AEGRGSARARLRLSVLDAARGGAPLRAARRVRAGDLRRSGAKDRDGPSRGGEECARRRRVDGCRADGAVGRRARVARRKRAAAVTANCVTRNTMATIAGNAVPSTTGRRAPALRRTWLFGPG